MRESTKVLIVALVCWLVAAGVVYDRSLHADAAKYRTALTAYEAALDAESAWALIALQTNTAHAHVKREQADRLVLETRLECEALERRLMDAPFAKHTGWAD